MEELKAIVCQAQDVIRNIPIEERASGTDSTSDTANPQVSPDCLVMPVFWEGVCLYWETPVLYLSIHF